jgi:hypothetical protein
MNAPITDDFNPDQDYLDGENEESSSFVEQEEPYTSSERNQEGQQNEEADESDDDDQDLPSDSEWKDNAAQRQQILRQ